MNIIADKHPMLCLNICLDQRRLKWLIGALWEPSLNNVCTYISGYIIIEEL